jgi:hypothetical protein
MQPYPPEAANLFAGHLFSQDRDLLRKIKV